MDCARYLLAVGADVDGKDAIHHFESLKSLGPALAEAIMNHDTEMTRWLLENGACPTDSTSLEAALETSPDILSILMAAIRDRPPGCTWRVDTETLNAVVRAKRVGLLRVLLSCRRNGRREWREGWPCYETPLAAAIRLGDDSGMELAQMMLCAGNAVDEIAFWENQCLDSKCCLPKETALLVAIEIKQIAMVQLLLDWQADVNKPATMGVQRTPLQKAAEVGSYSIVELLLGRGAEIDAPPAERGGATALQLAAIGGFIGVVELLLNWGADVNKSGAVVYGRTAIEGAAEHGRFDMVKFLHSRCIVEAKQYEQAVQLAIENGHNALADMLESFKTEVRADSHSNPLINTPPSGMLHHNDQAYICKVCNAPMSNISALRRHERTVHGTESKFKCNKCPQTFSRKDTLKRHLNSHRAPYDKIGFEKCHVCSKSYRKDYLQQHIKACRPV